MSAYNNLDLQLAGMPYGVAERVVESPIAAEAISYGAGVCFYAGDENNVYTPKMDTSTITGDRAFEGSNVIAVTVNGVAVPPVTYAGSNANTYLLLKNAIEAAIAGSVVTYTASSYILVIYIKGVNVTASYVTTGGSNQAVGTAVNTSTQIFKGTALFTQKAAVDSTGGYVQYEAINMLRTGYVWMYASKAVNAGTKAYLITAIGATQGQLTDASSDNILTSGVFRSNTIGAGLVLVELLAHKNI